MVIKNPYDFGRRCIKYFCNFLFIYTTLTDILLLCVLLLLLLLYTHIFNTTNSDSCAHCFVTCTIENKYLKKKEIGNKTTKTIIFGIFLLSKPPYFLNAKSGKQRTAHIYMCYLGQVATN